MAFAGWYRDPSGFTEARYWDGERWTDQVMNGAGVTSTAPMASGIETPPVPGSEYRAPTQPRTEVAPVSQKSSPTGAILGGVAVIVAVIALIFALTNDNGDTSDDEESPPTTEAPDEPARLRGRWDVRARAVGERRARARRPPDRDSSS